MDPSHQSLLLALMATFIFASSSIYFSKFSTRFGSIWTNGWRSFLTYPILVGLVFLWGGFHDISTTSIISFLVSGLVGFVIGDYFLLKAFATIGPARTLTVFGIQPFFMAVFSYLTLDQEINYLHIVAFLFMFMCLFLQNYDQYRIDRKWNMAGIALAVIGVLLDSTGVLLTRYGFENSPEVTMIEGQFYRGSIAMFIYIILFFFFDFNFLPKFVKLSSKDKFEVFASCVAGTLIALLLYLAAVKVGHLSSLSAIAITGPLFTSFIQAIVFKKPITKLMIFSYLFFIAGVVVLFKLG